jgi:exosome complex component MTR3
MAQHSNFDRRRINGPESSSHPIFEEEKELPTVTRTGRKNDEIRPICECIVPGGLVTRLNYISLPVLQLGLVSQANGSAYIETEKTKIAVAV